MSKMIPRRTFLKTSLATGALCAGGVAALTGLSACSAASGGASVGSNGNASGAKHWALVIDVEQINDSANFAEMVQACHSNHNVPDLNDAEVEVKWLWEESFEHCFEELNNDFLPKRIKEMNFPVLCNHCEEPACVRVCPTEATFKREDGIVSMDYHRCIGCRFCMTACPYNARSLNFYDPRLYLDEINPNYPTREKGIVEKCNFCVERLQEGLEPYCVEASQGALLFGDVNDPASEVRLALEGAFSLRRLPELGTEPSVYYLVGSQDEGEAFGSEGGEASTHA